MNWDQVESNWKLMKGRVREKWGRFSDDDLELMAGRKETLNEQLQERYGFAKHLADRELDAFARNLNAEDFTGLQPVLKPGA